METMVYLKESLNLVRMAYLYAIIRDIETEKLIRKEIYIDESEEISIRELCRSHNYAWDLSDSYTSYLSSIPNRDISSPYSHRNYREEAVYMERAISNLKSNYDVVACSHRKGGWTSITWNFTDDIKFKIHSNFGYGRTSYFHTLFIYKDIQLTPFSFFVKYKDSTVTTVTECTEHYELSYDEWRNVMDDCYKFYQSIETNDEKQIYQWIKDELNKMIEGLDQLSKSESFSMLEGSYGRYSGYTKLTGDDLWIIKSHKLGTALDFTESIKVLPGKFRPTNYIKRLYAICESFLPILKGKIDEEKRQIKNLKAKIRRLEKNEGYQLFSSVCQRYKPNLNNRRIFTRDFDFSATMNLFNLYKNIFSDGSLDILKEDIRYAWKTAKELNVLYARVMDRESFLNKLKREEENIRNCLHRNKV